MKIESNPIITDPIATRSNMEQVYNHVAQINREDSPFQVTVMETEGLIKVDITGVKPFSRPNNFAGSTHVLNALKGYITNPFSSWDANNTDVASIGVQA